MQFRRQVMAHARDNLQLRALNVVGGIAPGSKWHQLVVSTMDHQAGAVILLSLMRRSPEAMIASIWRAVPAG